MTLVELERIAERGNCEDMRRALAAATTGGEGFEVPSSRGDRVYHVRFVRCLEDGAVALWDCDCPAGRYGRTCRHIREVAALLDYIGDCLGYE